MTDNAQLTSRLLEALAQSIDPAKLAARLQSAGIGTAHSGAAGSAASAAASSPPRDAILGNLVLQDVLDDSILGARPGDAEFPLRALFGELAQRLASGEGLALAAGLNFYFRQPQSDEEVRLTLAVEVSRAFYRFAEHAQLDAKLLKGAAPLLARLLSTELTRSELVSVDHAIVFDSTCHERQAGSDAHSSRIVGARSFLARATPGQQLKKRALVVT